MTAFSFHLRDGSELLSVELPSAWCDSTVGRLQAFIAAKRGLEGWSCHLVTARGPVDTLLLVRAAIVRGEEVVLARGPNPMHGAEPTTRCTLWMWGRVVDGATVNVPTAVQLWPHRISAVALGTEHALVVTDAGLVLAWGSNSHGQLGTGGDGKHTAAAEAALGPLTLALPLPLPTVPIPAPSCNSSHERSIQSLARIR